MVWDFFKENLNFNALSSGVRNVGKAGYGLLTNPIGEFNGGLKEMVGWFIDIPDIPDFSAQNRGTLINKSGSDINIPVLYGERIIGGTRVFVGTSGTSNEFLYIALVLCEGPVQQISDVYINDVLSTDSKFSGLVTIDKKLGGTDSDTASTLLDDHPSWDGNNKLQGLAYLGVRLKYSQDVFSGIPEIKARVRGRKIYDPRKDSTSSGYDASLGVSTHRENDPTTWEYSNNNVICLRDYLTDSRYGKGLDPAEIDDVAIKESANFLDTQVTEYTGASGTVSTYTCNMLVDTRNTLFSNVQLMLKSFRGLIPYSNGMYKIRVDDNPATTTYAFTEDNILSDISVQSASRRDRYNRVIAKFSNEELNYEYDEISYPELNDATHTTYLNEDNGFLQESTIDLPATTTAYQARDIAKIALLISRNQTLTVSLVGDADSIKCEVGDKVTVTYAPLGFSAKQFKVRSMTINNDLTCSFTLLEHDSTIFGWFESDQVTVSTPPSILTPNLSAPPTPSAGTVTIVTETDADGSINKVIQYSMPVSTYEFWDGNIVSYRVDSGDDQTFETRGDKFRLYGWTAGSTYYFKHRTRASTGRVSLASTTQTLTTTISDSVTVDGGRLIDDTTPFSKTEAFTEKSFGGTPAAPYYKGYVGPTGVGGGFENSDFAVGGKGYDNAAYDTGGVLGYSEAAVGVQAMTENIILSGYTGWFGALTAVGAYDYTETSYRSKAILGNTNMAGFFTVGPELSEAISSTDNTNPVRITLSSASDSQTNDVVLITGVTTMTQLNNNYYILSRINSTTFDLYDLSTGNPVNGTGWSDGTGGTMKNVLRPDLEKNVSGSNPHQASIELARLNGTAYAYYINSGTTGPFTASHDGLVAKEIDQPEIGDIMVDIDVFAAPNVNDCITTMKLSSQANEVGVIGVCAGFSGPTFLPAALSEAKVIVKNEPSPPDTRKLKDEYASVPENYNFIAVNCIGEGKINVCGQNGDISVGDLIVASDMAGKGMKQDGDIIRSYTVAKSRENVTFASADEVKQIACIYLGG